ncbi:hypothetical protein EYB53_022820 [Candidatus Chloroploca sp. M-50]|uniref:Glycosyltransferase RgtA/B/C/D-like domain-containing protein n=1 Tax=Candidatus Chloroploca mongolica TaxID=2528176 RepID=A0ABS4DGJ0_9CHLR|nr:hypothetical protein [Candidatus Chloroploca mongolica]MBP1468184.1 hypothetical protein [Candidatus Chloroploca mongolica]MBP1468564.1 hypothetical protein [Candidatus Chloroploca mongolica]
MLYRPSLVRVAQVALGLLAIAYLLYAAAHVRQLLAFPFPLDYGEGPLVAQVERLRAGVPIWRLYADPENAPFLIVNYPPLYLVLTAVLTPLTGSVLIAGRLLSLVATLAAMGAIAWLSHPGATTASPTVRRTSWLLVLLFLTIPIVREWSALMRVDLLGLALGLWGLVVLVHPPLPSLRRVAVAGLLLTASLFVKPSLLAAPVAASAWLAWQVLPSLIDARQTLPGRRRRRRYADRLPLYRLVVLGLTLGLAGGLTLLAMQWASQGWFALHVVAANANRWDAELALQFWAQQIRLRWALAAAALLVVFAGLSLMRRAPVAAAAERLSEKGVSVVRHHVMHPWSAGFSRLKSALRSKPSTFQTASEAELDALPSRSSSRTLPCSAVEREPGGEVSWPRSSFQLALLYTLAGFLTALGVGKVGAYSNYFLELYAGLIWLIALAPSLIRCWLPWRGLLFYGLLVLALAYYPPLWHADQLRPASLVEPLKPRFVFGRHGLLTDARRQAEVLAAQTRVGTLLTMTVQAAGPVVLTDMPGVAAAAGVTSRLQAFEMRQLLDQGLADETALLHELANGTLPLVVLDYLGNWLSPGVVELVQRRYAHDGSLGTFDLYRPVATGPASPLDGELVLGDTALRLTSYAIVPSVGQIYEPGELVTLTLLWQRTAMPPSNDNLSVVVDLTTLDGGIVATSTRRLIYGVYPPSRWPTDATVQHMHPFAVPTNLPPGSYQIKVSLADPKGASADVILPTTLAVAPQGGQYVAATDYMVPGVMWAAWTNLGGLERLGWPLTPLVPFDWGRLQCFERLCLELRGNAVTPRPSGTTLYLGETRRSTTCRDGNDANERLCPSMAEAAARIALPGTPVSGEIWQGDRIVQWTTHARFEHPLDDDAVMLGRLGAETLRLPPGQRYRWP